MSIKKKIIITKHARERMIERGITHKEVEKTIKEGIKIDEYERIRAICEVETGRFITVGYNEQRKYYVVRTAFTSGKTDIELYRRLKR